MKKQIVYMFFALTGLLGTPSQTVKAEEKTFFPETRLLQFESSKHRFHFEKEQNFVFFAEESWIHFWQQHSLPVDSAPDAKINWEEEVIFAFFWPASEEKAKSLPALISTQILEGPQNERTLEIAAALIRPCDEKKEESSPSLFLIFKEAELLFNRMLFHSIESQQLACDARAVTTLD